MKIVITDFLKTFEFHNSTMLNHLGKSHDITYVDQPISYSQMRELMMSHDLAWYEFCDNFFYENMRHPKACKVINRLHSYELFTQVPFNVGWKGCDKLLVVSEEVKAMIQTAQNNNKFTVPIPDIDIFPNGVDFNKFQNENKTYNTKIAYVGWINYKKNPPLFLYLMDALRNRGMPHTLHIAGISQDERYTFYLNDMIDKMRLRERVFFDGWIPYNILPEWLKDKSYILSTSLFESLGNSIIESIASKCLPLIHNFYGADSRFGSNSVFHGIDDFMGLLRYYERMTQPEKKVAANKNRSQLKTKYDINLLLNKLDSIILSTREG